MIDDEIPAHEASPDADWTPEQWEAWRAENRRILAAGGTLSTNFMADGSIECWAELDGKQWRRDPRWVEQP